MIGQVIGDRYRVLDQLDEDSLAISYLARDQAQNEMVVLRLIRSDLDTAQEFLERFRPEAEKLAQLISPYIVKLLDQGLAEAGPYVVFEYVGEKSLANLGQAQGALPIQQALDIGRQLGLCLVDAHAHDLVHGALSPANILLAADDSIKITNFGLTQGLDLGRLMAGDQLESDAYHAPELVAGREPDSRADLYSLGAVLFEMLTGEPPTLVDDLPDGGRRPSRLQPELSPEIDDLVTRCLAPDPQDRPQSAAEFLGGIEEALRTRAMAAQGAILGREEALAGHTLGAYRLVEKLGRGGMASVYKAYEPALDRYVAIKVLPQHFASDPQFVARFRREAKAIARLNHPNIVPVFNFGEEGDLTYIAMRFVEGGTLKELMGKPMPPTQAVKLATQIARALSYAHKRNVVHRDVKPANVLLAEGDWPLLSDFGLARMVGSSMQITQTGVGVGTPAYMSPEQGQGHTVDGRSDIYSLGIMLYEMLTGIVPFQADTPMAVVLKHITAPMPTPRQVNPEIPESLERVILKATAKDPAQRHQTADDLIEALDRALTGLPVEAPPAPAPSPVTDTIIPSAPPSAVTEVPSPAAEVSAPTQALPAPARKLPIPIWALALAGLLLVVGLVAGLALSGSGGGRGRRAEEGEEEALPAAFVGEGGDFWDFESGDAQGWSLDDQGWQVIETEDGYALEGSVPETGSEGPPMQASPPHLPPPDDFFMTFRVQIATDGFPNITFRDDSGPSSCRFYELWLDTHRLEIWKQPGQCGPPDVKLIQASSPLERGTWHQVGLIAVGPTIEVTVDDQHVISLEDVEAVLAGSLNIAPGGPPGSRFLIDDVRISPITRQEAKKYLAQFEGSPAVATAPETPAPVTEITLPEGAIEVMPCDEEGLGRGLCIFPLEGGRPIRILEDSELDISRQPTWSPDGQRITFSALKPGDRDDKDNRIYVVNADGSDLTQLPPIDNDIGPAWSPDGEWLAFHSSCDLAIMHPDGSEPTKVWRHRNSGCVEEPQWSPDGKSIVASIIVGDDRVLPATREVWIISRDEGTITPVATIVHESDRCMDRVVAFSPDGKQVAYVDENCTPQLVNADGSGQPTPLEIFPFWWSAVVHPQWEGQEVVSVVGATPEPASAGGPPPEAGDVRPCDWDGRGRGLCIYPASGGDPIQILGETELQLIGSASWSPDGQQIAFGAIEPGEQGDQDTNIYIVNADGGSLTELPSLCNDLHPAWSPDGEWLAFHSCGRVAIMRPDGSDSTVIWDGAKDTAGFQWSPDSQSIVFSAMLDDPTRLPFTREILVIPRDGRSTINVATVVHEREDCNWYEVAFSPDGTQVAYFDAECRPWIANADGSGQATRLDDFPYPWTSSFHPQWEGKQAAATTQPAPPSEPEGAIVERCRDQSSVQICLYDPRTDQSTQLTTDLEFGQIHYAAWSPDGGQIVFDAGSDTDHTLYLINADGSGLRQITSGDVNDIDPAWSPDGDWIAFHRNCSLWVIRPDGSDGRKLLDGSSSLCAIWPAWSPDSQQIAFSNTLGPGEDEAMFEVWAVNRDGSDPRVLYAFEQPIGGAQVAWSPDGGRLACRYFDDGREEVFLLNVDGSGEPQRIEDTPWSWFPSFHPQWGDER